MKVHFIAVGGSAMHNIALALQKNNYQVSGSDDVIYEPSRSRLKKHHLLPDAPGWFPEKLDSTFDAVILGMHAREDNPELIRAKELGLKIYSYPEFLYEHSKNKTRVVIGGSQGKTTITSMILHVLNYHHKEVDYLVGAQLPGFENMVNLTEINDFILLEGDEYLSSALDKRPKFHLYKPNIALLSGIAWDHINVFPTFGNYLDQFKIFVESIVSGGILVYNEEDEEINKIVEQTANQIRKHPYSTPQYRVENHITVLDTPEGEMEIEVFGFHNLSNLSGAKWICQHMGIDEDDFYEAIASFKGASKRLEKILELPETIIFKDFAHSPSKVLASTKAVREQYPNLKLVTCLELHTYSSLSSDFLSQYKNSLEVVDEAVIFFLPETLSLKKMPILNEVQIREAFDKKGLIIFTNTETFKEYLENMNYKKSVILFMSSGNYGGLDLREVSNWVKTD